MDPQFFRRKREAELRIEKDGESRHTTLEVHHIEQETARQEPATLRPKTGLEDPAALPQRSGWLILAAVIAIGIVVVLVIVLSSGGA
jgi:hypothetical protein